MKIMKNNGIYGFKLQAAKVKLLAYADNVAISTTGLVGLVYGV